MLLEMEGEALRQVGGQMSASVNAYRRALKQVLGDERDLILARSGWRHHHHMTVGTCCGGCI